MLDIEVAIEFKTEIVPLTLELAKHYNRMATLKGDRDPDSPRGKQRVAYLHEVYRAGDFHSPEWADVLVTSEKGKKYRIDGGGSSRMLIQLGVDFPENMVVTLRHFRAPNIEAAIRLYEQFNLRISTRTFTDLVRNRAFNVNILNNVSITAVNIAIRGVCCHLSLHNPSEKFNPLDYISSEKEFIKWENGFTGISRLKRTAVVAAAYATFIFNKSVADEFWTMVRDDTSKNPKCPTRTLCNFLRAFDANVMILSKCQDPPKRIIYVKCFHAWNAWRQGKTTNLKYHKGCSIPKLI